MARFHVRTFDVADHVTVTIAGDVDLSCIELLARSFAAALDADRPIVVDCARITSFSAAGLSVLAEAEALAHSRHIRFQLSCVPRAILRVLALSDTRFAFDIAGADSV